MTQIPFIGYHCDGFPPVENALDEPNGLLVAGGDLAPERLIEAYSKGILTFDTAFQDVISSCSKPRPSGDGTWITTDMIDAYTRLHQLGYAHSVEAWMGDELVGGLYGICLGSIFFGESMFSTESNASKVAF